MATMLQHRGEAGSRLNLLSFKRTTRHKLRAFFRLRAVWRGGSGDVVTALQYIPMYAKCTSLDYWAVSRTTNIPPYFIGHIYSFVNWSPKNLEKQSNL